MLHASILSFNKGDNSLFVKIFDQAVSSIDKIKVNSTEKLSILTSDDLLIGRPDEYNYYELKDVEQAQLYEDLYKAKIQKMNAEYQISDAQAMLEAHRLYRNKENDQKRQEKTDKGFER